MERNRFEYGHIIDQNTFEQTAEEIKREVCEKINFKNGILREINEVQWMYAGKKMFILFCV